MIRYSLSLALLVCCLQSTASAVFILDNSLSVENVVSFGSNSGVIGGIPWSFELTPDNGPVFVTTYSLGGVRKISDESQVLSLGSSQVGSNESFRHISLGADGLLYASSTATGPTSWLWRQSGNQILRAWSIPEAGFARIAADESGNVVVSSGGANTGGLTGYDASGTQLFNILGSGSVSVDDAVGTNYHDGTFYWLDRDYKINTVDLAGNVAYTGLQFQDQYLTGTDTLGYGLWRDGDAWFTAANLVDAFGAFKNAFGIYRLMDGVTEPLAYGTGEFPREIRIQNGTLYIPGFTLGTLEDFEIEPVFGNSLTDGGLGFLMSSDEQSLAQINGVLGQLSGFGPAPIPEPSSGLLLLLGACLICRCTSVHTRREKTLSSRD